MRGRRLQRQRLHLQLCRSQGSAQLGLAARPGRSQPPCPKLPSVPPAAKRLLRPQSPSDDRSGDHYKGIGTLNTSQRSVPSRNIGIYLHDRFTFLCIVYIK